MEIEKQWEFEGFAFDIEEKINQILMNDNNSYWFHFRSIPWYKIRRISIENPVILKKIVLEELNFHIEVEIRKKIGEVFSKWVIKAENLC
jgi:hypothetical protein